MIELRRHVERIVRPIRASGIRKMRMREELLGHLTPHLRRGVGGAAKRRKRGGLAAAAGRFGDPATLRAELQATVPWIERVMCAPLPRPTSRFAPSAWRIGHCLCATDGRLGDDNQCPRLDSAHGHARSHRSSEDPRGAPGGILLLIVAYVFVVPTTRFWSCAAG